MNVKTLILTGFLVLSTAACVVRARPAYVEAPPPAPQYEEVYVRPGYLWIRGHWVWDGGRWVWERGHWDSERRGYVWRDGYWQNRGGRYYWVDGRWDVGAPPAAGNVIIRDHRQEPQPYQPPPGTVVVPS